MDGGIPPGFGPMQTRQIPSHDNQRGDRRPARQSGSQGRFANNTYEVWSGSGSGGGDEARFEAPHGKDGIDLPIEGKPTSAVPVVGDDANWTILAVHPRLGDYVVTEGIVVVADRVVVVGDIGHVLRAHVCSPPNQCKDQWD